MGTGVLPLSVDDPGAKVTRSSRTLVTADNGKDPPQNSRTLSQAWVRDRSSTGWPRTHAARGGRRDGYRGHRGLHRYRASARGEHWARALSREGWKVLDGALPNDEERLRALYEKLADHGNLMVVVDQLVTIKALAVRGVRSWASPQTS